MKTRSIVVAVLLTALAACSGEPAPVDAPAAAPAKQAPVEPADNAKQRAERVDPRRGGFEIVLGEWAVTPEAPAVRPGRVTFIVHNRGTMDHGYEMELEGESSGHGSGDLFKAESELVRPGESTRMTVTLGPGLYEIECLVDGHDDMGMEAVLEVRADAPLVAVEAEAEPGRIAIRDFAFEPATATVAVGSEVSWRNDDPADHTVTSRDGTFGSDVIAPGGSFEYRFDAPGVYAYRCAIHPEMKGQVRVE